MISQFSIVALVHFLAVASPGPDFILVSRQAFLYGRNSAIYTTLGISCGIFVHVLYCIFGLGYILNEFQDLIFYLKLSCSIYLAYLGIVSIFIYSKSQFLNQEKKSLKQIDISNFKSFRLGFITNVLNIKATLFFLSLYSFILTSSPNISLYVKISYGIWMVLVTGLWFLIVSLFLTNRIFKNIVKKYYLSINRLMGIILIYISIKLFLN